MSVARIASFLVPIILLAVGCATRPAPHYTQSRNDGRTIETAIPIRANTALDAVNWEDRHILERQPDIKQRLSSLTIVNHRVYDQVDVNGSDGQGRRYYFDVDKIYGIHEY
ncbi:hypothetical protein ACFPL7_09355 [Dongia soli]|uniref:Lipoprotein n=1 Tax=Dongia soli TaxID=600628 RepID=A0ABU5EA89_9PROT|nr:hypothetical protein [Dongia soli]MDY0883154.1 hypothetical protein [Dongia soli]